MDMSIRNVDPSVHGEVRVTIRYMHWSCSIATAHSTVHAKLDITKFVYFLISVPCCLKEEDKIEVLKLLF